VLTGARREAVHLSFRHRLIDVATSLPAINTGMTRATITGNVLDHLCTDDIHLGWTGSHSSFEEMTWDLIMVDVDRFVRWANHDYTT
jgi:hypothetical protein